jgi:hypothetical protein
MALRSLICRSADVPNSRVTRRKPDWQAKRRDAPMMPSGGVTSMVYRSFTADDEIVPQR